MNTDAISPPDGSILGSPGVSAPPAETPPVTPPAETPPVTPPVITPPVPTSDITPAETPPVATPLVDKTIIGTPPITADSTTPDLSWKNSLPDDIKSDPSLGHINDINALAKSYVHSQRQLGADKIIVPSKHADDAEWKGVFTKLGLPESVEKYEVTPSDPKTVDKDFFGAFKQQAFDLGILPHQAQKLSTWYDEKSKSLISTIEDQKAIESKEKLEALRKEWGQGFDTKTLAARAAIKQFDDEENTFSEYLNTSGLGNDPILIKFFNKIGESMNEDSFKGDSIANIGKTPEQAQAEINSIFGNPKHPHNVADHPEHDSAVKEMKKLFEVTTPNLNASA